VPAGLTALPARVESVERLGNITYAYLDGGTPEVITVQVMGHSDLQPGQEVQVGLRSDQVHVFDAAGAVMASAVGR
jgi:multiple sugar transport system ATP-binding protein/lactose/L-arabinose transport system ATP-binding protein